MLSRYYVEIIILIIILMVVFFFYLHAVSAHSRVDRGNLVLRYSVPHFLPNSGGIACWVAELNAALNLDTREERKYKFK